MSPKNLPSIYDRVDKSSSSGAWVESALTGKAASFSEHGTETNMDGSFGIDIKRKEKDAIYKVDAEHVDSLGNLKSQKAKVDSMGSMLTHKSDKSDSVSTKTTSKSRDVSVKTSVENKGHTDSVVIGSVETMPKHDMSPGGSATGMVIQHGGTAAFDVIESSAIYNGEPQRVFVLNKPKPKETETVITSEITVEDTHHIDTKQEQTKSSVEAKVEQVGTQTQGNIVSHVAGDATAVSKLDLAASTNEHVSDSSVQSEQSKTSSIVIDSSTANNYDGTTILNDQTNNVDINMVGINQQNTVMDLRGASTSTDSQYVPESTLHSNDFMATGTNQFGFEFNPAFGETHGGFEGSNTNFLDQSSFTDTYSASDAFTANTASNTNFGEYQGGWGDMNTFSIGNEGAMGVGGMDGTEFNQFSARNALQGMSQGAPVNADLSTSNIDSRIHDASVTDSGFGHMYAGTDTAVESNGNTMFNDSAWGMDAGFSEFSTGGSNTGFAEYSGGSAVGSNSLIVEDTAQSGVRDQQSLLTTGSTFGVSGFTEPRLSLVKSQSDVITQSVGSGDQTSSLSPSQGEISNILTNIVDLYNKKSEVISEAKSTLGVDSTSRKDANTNIDINAHPSGFIESHPGKVSDNLWVDVPYPTATDGATSRVDALSVDGSMGRQDTNQIREVVPEYKASDVGSVSSSNTFLSNKAESSSSAAMNIDTANILLQDLMTVGGIDATASQSETSMTVPSESTDIQVIGSASKVSTENWALSGRDTAGQIRNGALRDKIQNAIEKPKTDNIPPGSGVVRYDTVSTEGAFDLSMPPDSRPDRRGSVSMAGGKTLTVELPANGRPGVISEASRATSQSQITSLRSGSIAREGGSFRGRVREATPEINIEEQLRDFNVSAIPDDGVLSAMGSRDGIIPFDPR